MIPTTPYGYLLLFGASLIVGVGYNVGAWLVGKILK